METSKKHEAIGSNAMHSSQSKPSTNYAMRVFYALAIIFVVAGHSSIYSPAGFNFGYNLFPVYAFHMPMFIFAAGYFYNPKHEKHPVRFLLGKVKRLLIPMFSIHALLGCFASFLATRGFTSYADVEVTLHNVFVEPFLHDNMHMFSFDLATWFLIPMFVASCAYMVLHAVVVRGSGKVRLALDTVLGIVLVAMGAWVIASFGTGEGQEAVVKDDMLRVYQSMFFLSFMAIGYYYKTYLEKYLERIPDVIALVALAVVQLCLVFTYGGDLTMVVCWLGFPAGIAGTFAMGLVGTLFWLRVSKILAPGLSRSWLVNEIGKNTFSIMAFHFVGFFLFNLIMYKVMKATDGAWFKTFSEEAFFEGGIYYKCIPANMTISPAASDAWGMLYVMFGVGLPLLLHRLWVLASLPCRKAYGKVKASLTGDADGAGTQPGSETVDGQGNKGDIVSREDGGASISRRPASPAPRPHKRRPHPNPSDGNHRKVGRDGNGDGRQPRHDGTGGGNRRRHADPTSQIGGHAGNGKGSEQGSTKSPARRQADGASHETGKGSRPSGSMSRSEKRKPISSVAPSPRNDSSASGKVTGVPVSTGKNPTGTVGESKPKANASQPTKAADVVPSKADGKSEAASTTQIRKRIHIADKVDQLKK